MACGIGYADGSKEDLPRLMESFEQWYKDIDSNVNASDHKVFKKEIQEVEEHLLKLKFNADPTIQDIEKEISREKSEIRKLKNRLKESTYLVPARGEEFIKSCYEQCLIERANMCGIVDRDELIKILKESYKFCCMKSREQLTQLTEVICGKNQKSNSVEPEKLEELRRAAAFESVPGLRKAFAKQKHHRKNIKDPRDQEKFQNYIHECIKISWLVAIQSTPIRFVYDHTEKLQSGRRCFRVARKCDNNQIRKIEQQNISETTAETDRPMSSYKYDIVYPAMVQGENIIKYGFIQDKVY